MTGNVMDFSDNNGYRWSAINPNGRRQAIVNESFGSENIE